MKKVFCIVLSVFTFVSLSACGETSSSSNIQSSSPPISSSIQNDSSTGQDIQADVGVLTVDILYPATLIENMENTAEEMVENAKAEDGVLNAEVDSGGNVVITVTKEKHRQMLDEMKKAIDDYIVTCTDGTFSSVKAVEANADYSSFKITVDKAAFENSFDAFVGFGLGVMGSTYLAIQGENNPNVEMNYIDEATEEIFKTDIFPDDMQ